MPIKQSKVCHFLIWHNYLKFGWGIRFGFKNLNTFARGLFKIVKLAIEFFFVCVWVGWGLQQSTTIKQPVIQQPFHSLVAFVMVISRAASQCLIKNLLRWQPGKSLVYSKKKRLGRELTNIKNQGNQW